MWGGGAAATGRWGLRVGDARARFQFQGCWGSLELGQHAQQVFAGLGISLQGPEGGRPVHGSYYLYVLAAWQHRTPLHDALLEYALTVSSAAVLV